MFSLTSIFVVLAAYTLVVFSRTEEPIPKPLPSYRLPNNTRPIAYNIHITTHVHTQQHFFFTGEVAIRFVASSPSRRITLHHRELSIKNATLVLARERAEPIVLNAYEYDQVTEFLTFTLRSSELRIDAEYILTIGYLGMLRWNGSQGFYVSSYMTAAGARRWFAATQFQQTDARHGFPCYDEPALRALFTIRITHGSMYHALSNMPAASKVPTPNKQGYVTTTFQTTVSPMPTYLVAFLVSDLTAISVSNDRGFEHSIYARPEVIANGKLALGLSAKYLVLFEHYFDRDFTYPKLDHVAIETREGAMENWGLMVYAEDRLLFNETESTFNERRRVAISVAHEFSHNWFGNLVTPKWWTYIWMNEGFATLFGYMGADWLFPEWRIMDTFMFFEMQSVIDLDVKSRSQPMTRYVESPADIKRLFNGVNYSKAGCVIYMLMQAFTEESFKSGLIEYFKSKANTDVSEEDLFSELEKAVKSDGTLGKEYSVASIFSSWTSQAGFPVVTVERNYKTGGVVMTQTRYMHKNDRQHYSNIWAIPYNIWTASDGPITPNRTSWFVERKAKLNVGGAASNGWISMNKRHTGYYRVRYDLRNYWMLAEALIQNPKQFDSTIRAQLISDAFDMVEFEHLNYEVALNLTKYLKKEFEYTPWSAALRGLAKVFLIYSWSPLYPRLQRYYVQLCSPIYNEVGLFSQPGENIFRKDARNEIVHFACHLGSEKCLNETNRVLNDYLTENVSIHPDHRSHILCNGMRSATLEQYEQLTIKLNTDGKDNEQWRKYILQALSCVLDIELIRKHLHLAVFVNESSFQSTLEGVQAFKETAVHSPHAAVETITFLHDNLDVMNTTYGPRLLEEIILHVAEYVVGIGPSNDFLHFLNDALDNDYINMDAYDASTDTIAMRGHWVELHAQVIDFWITKNYHGHTGHSGFAQLFGSPTLAVIMFIVSQLLFSR